MRMSHLNCLMKWGLTIELVYSSFPLLIQLCLFGDATFFLLRSGRDFAGSEVLTKEEKTADV